MSKYIKPRKITVNGNVFYWQHAHKHKEDGTCIEMFIAKCEDHERSKLTIEMPMVENMFSEGYDPNGGMIFYKGTGKSHNLRTPKMAAHFIIKALKLGWDIEANKPFRLLEATYLLEDAPVEEN